MKINYESMVDFSMSYTHVMDANDLLKCLDDAIHMIRYFDKTPTMRLVAFNAETRSPKLLYNFLLTRRAILKKKPYANTIFMEIKYILDAIHLVVNRRCYIMRSIKLSYYAKSRIIMLSDLVYGHITQYIRNPLIQHVIALEDTCFALSKELDKI